MSAQPTAANDNASGEHMHADQTPAHGLTPTQDIIEVDVPPHGAPALQASLAAALAERPLHKIVAATMATYGEFPLHYRMLVVIEYL